MILQGPYIQELTAYRFKFLKGLLADVLSRNPTALGYNLAPFSALELPPVQPKAVRKNPNLWKKNDFRRRKSWAFKVLDYIYAECLANGTTPVIYGPMFPDSRRQYALERIGQEPFIKAVKIGGAQTKWVEWFTTWFSGHNSRVGAAWLDFWVEVVNRYPEAIFVDGTEPHGGPLDRPPNQFTAAVQAVTPGVLRAGIDEIHFNPGDPVPAPGVDGSALDAWAVLDNWGKSDRRYKVQRRPSLRLRFAGLSGWGDGAPTQEAAIEAEADYFSEVLVTAHAQGRRGVLYLFTPGWSAFDISSARNPALQRPGFASASVPPFGRIQERLTETANNLT
jgi:hypothetical protein